VYVCGTSVPNQKSILARKVIDVVPRSRKQKQDGWSGPLRWHGTARSSVDRGKRWESECTQSQQTSPFHTSSETERTPGTKIVYTRCVCVCVCSEEQVASRRQIGKPFCFTHTHTSTTLEGQPLMVYGALEHILVTILKRYRYKCVYTLLLYFRKRVITCQDGNRERNLKTPPTSFHFSPWVIICFIHISFQTFYINRYLWYNIICIGTNVTSSP